MIMPVIKLLELRDCNSNDPCMTPKRHKRGNWFVSPRYQPTQNKKSGVAFAAVYALQIEAPVSLFIGASPPKGPGTMRCACTLKESI